MPEGIVTTRSKETGRPSELTDLVIYTTLGATYQFPDMLHEQVQESLEYLSRYYEAPDTNFVARNVSEAVLMLPLRIVERMDARVWDGHTYVSRTVWVAGGG